jgi:hypothetical protein
MKVLWRTCVALPLFAAAGLTAGASVVSPVTSAAAVSPAPNPPAIAWVKDSVHSLDVFSPDADSTYLINGYGTADGARTVIRGQVPAARYWSFTGYPYPSGPPWVHSYDTNITQSHGRYVVTISASCTHVVGTCLATTSAGQAGLLVMRLYVPVDINTAGTGGVPPPTLSYQSVTGASLTLAQASGTHTIDNVMALLRLKEGTLPAVLTRTYPPEAPVSSAVVDPQPKAFVATSPGPYSNPDNVYEHLTFTSTRGNLVVSAKAPTYQSSSAGANDLDRPPSRAPQVRYWSLCVDFKGGYTGACIRDQQVHLPRGSDRFTVVVAPTCPVHGYTNCLTAGPEPLQRALLYRNLLPSPAFASMAFKGAYGLTAMYVARPG